MAELPLGLLPPGQVAVIKEVAGGREVRRRLTALGFVPGSEVQVIRNELWGPLIVALGEGRVALGRGMAQKIFVEASSIKAP